MSSMTRLTKIKFLKEDEDISVWINVVHRGERGGPYLVVKCIGVISPKKLRDGTILYRISLDGMTRSLTLRTEMAARRYVLHKFNEVVATVENKIEELQAEDREAEEQQGG